MSLLSSYTALPRAARWGIIGLAAIAVYFAVVEPTLDYKATLDARADAAAIRLANYRRGGESRARAADTIRRGQERFAAIAFPGEGDQAAEALNKAINKVLDDNHVGKAVLRSRTVPLNPGPLDRVLRPGEKIERRIVDIQFDGTPEQAAAVLAALEQQPQVTQVTRVQLDRQPEGRILRAAITAEAWARARKEAR
ncbi:MAG: hypothetical protein IT437_05225 [Phycisphaerales bacterium]|nr:hypothetical protein [Phycisphaerales bacterium]